MSASRVIRVAAVQAAPVVLDLAGSLDHLEEWVRRAAAERAAIVAFGECWLTGYPAWLDESPDAALWGHPGAKAVFERLADNSVAVPGPATERLGKLARSLKLTLVIGMHERAGRTLYNTQLTFGPDGTLANHHRKLMPTAHERMIWGLGHGTPLRAVTLQEVRVGGLICWEHWMPLARQAMHEAAEEIHVAVWPTVRDMYQVASRHYAFEGRCFVLAAGLLTAARDLPSDLELPEEMKGKPDALVCAGGSCIIAPDGALVAGPVFDREEILIADIDLGTIAEESMALDVTGHYSRPDVFQFTKRVVT